MHFLAKFSTYLLWSFFSIIIFLLLVGLAKTDRNISSYVGFLNANDWSMFHWSQPASRSDPFWPNSQASGDIADIFSDEAIDTELSGLDIFDTSMEQDMATFSGTTEESYGFVATGQEDLGVEVGTGPISKPELLDMLKQRVEK